ncbi:hypothetical protein ACN2C7_13230 [Caulobacter sp. ErkDOM-E]|uniref:hypothetical protein n=1 Tax=Caulobacter sp. ErkDOM-E TaxID=3402778 RepID=UPI003AF804AA
MTKRKQPENRLHRSSGFSPLYGIYSIGLALLAGASLGTFIYGVGTDIYAMAYERVGAVVTWSSFGLLAICELVVGSIWLKLTTRRLTALGYRKRLAWLPVSAWIVTFALPMALVAMSPDSDDPGPVGAAFLMMALLVLSMLLSIGFVGALVFSRGDGTTSDPSTSPQTDFGSI